MHSHSWREIRLLRADLQYCLAEYNEPLATSSTLTMSRANETLLNRATNRSEANSRPVEPPLNRRICQITCKAIFYLTNDFSPLPIDFYSLSLKQIDVALLTSGAPSR